MDYSFTSEGVHGILEEKDYQCIYLVFFLIFGYLNKATGSIEDVEPMKVNNTYTELLLELYSRS